GLGLAIVWSIVEVHGGTAVASSEGAGRGATFSVDLPIMAVPVPALPTLAAPAPSPSPGTDVRLNGIRVLAVDDHDDSRHLTGMILEQCGADVMLTASV